MNRRDIQKWEGVKFDNFPLKLWKETKNSHIYVFGGRYFTLTGHWEGVVYKGRYMFYTPKWTQEEIIKHTWILTEAQEDAPVKLKQRRYIINKEEASIVTTYKYVTKMITRRYYKLQLADDKPVKYYARFVGGHYKTTLSGYGHDRNYGQRVLNSEQIVVCETSNHCRSGRYGNWAKLILVPVEAGEIKVEEWGVF